jgi:hypothetical protein
MFRAEIRGRAQLLNRLGYSRLSATARINANVRWEYLEPPFLADFALAEEVPELVAGVYEKA